MPLGIAVVSRCGILHGRAPGVVTVSRHTISPYAASPVKLDDEDWLALSDVCSK